MSPDPVTLERLRRSLSDLEARQHARGGVADSGFWAGVARATAGEARTRRSSSRSRSRSGSSSHSGAGSGSSARSAAGRPAPGARGPWAGVPAEWLEQVAADGSAIPWLDAAGYEQMVQDPAWIEATATRAEERERRGAGGEGSTGGAGRVRSIEGDAVAGFDLNQHDDADLRAAAELLAARRRSQEVALVRIVAELVSRGGRVGGLSPVDWLRGNDPSLSAGQAAAFVTVGSALSEARWSRLRLLVLTQQLSVAQAAQIVDFDTRTRPVADPHDLATALADLTEQAPALRAEELARLVRHHAEQVRPPSDEERLDRGRREARGLWFSRPDRTGMVGLRATLDPEAAAVLKAAVDPLSAPTPEVDDHGRTVHPDSRTPARRRADALLTIVRRGVEAADGVQVTDKAKVVVLIDHDVLAGRARGAADTLTGDVLSPSVARRLACDAEVLPLVLGTQGEPLDLGRSRRLFTRGQRLALVVRDRGCSFPGCSVPATWCDAHHVVHWSRGGPTSLANGALLCPRHHTHVHDRDLTATVTTTGVTWHT